MDTESRAPRPPRCTYELGSIYSYGSEVPQNDVEARKWYTLAADQGYYPAQMGLVRITNTDKAGRKITFKRLNGGPSSSQTHAPKSSSIRSYQPRSFGARNDAGQDSGGAEASQRVEAKADFAITPAMKTKHPVASPLFEGSLRWPA